MLTFDGRPKGSLWHAPDVYVLHPLKEDFDLTGLSVSGGSLILTREAAEKLGHIIDPVGELLPVWCDGVEYKLLNVTEVVNCLDRQRTQFRRFTASGEPLGPLKYEFHPKRFTRSIFKVPETRATEILASERDGDTKHEFKAAVEAYGLKGIHFHLLWED